MDHQIRPKQPAPSQTSQSSPPKRGRKKSLHRLVVPVVLLVVFVAIFATYKITVVDKRLTGVEKGSYQALFLTNGQVYFGKLSRADADTVKITDVFYLQVQQSDQAESDIQNVGGVGQGESQLVKLGGELHGPKDQMYIERSQVLFWENLNDDSKVVEAIKNYSEK